MIIRPIWKHERKSKWQLIWRGPKVKWPVFLRLGFKIGMTLPFNTTLSLRLFSDLRFHHRWLLRERHILEKARYCRYHKRQAPASSDKGLLLALLRTKLEPSHVRDIFWSVFWSWNILYLRLLPVFLHEVWEVFDSDPRSSPWWRSTLEWFPSFSRLPRVCSHRIMWIIKSRAFPQGSSGLSKGRVAWKSQSVSTSYLDSQSACLCLKLYFSTLVRECFAIQQTPRGFGKFNTADIETKASKANPHSCIIAFFWLSSYASLSFSLMFCVFCSDFTLICFAWPLAFTFEVGQTDGAELERIVNLFAGPITQPFALSSSILFCSSFFEINFFQFLNWLCHLR